MNATGLNNPIFGLMSQSGMGQNSSIMNPGMNNMNNSGMNQNMGMGMGMNNMNSGMGMNNGMNPNMGTGMGMNNGMNLNMGTGMGMNNGMMNQNSGMNMMNMGMNQNMGAGMGMNPNMAMNNMMMMQMNNQMQLMNQMTQMMQNQNQNTSQNQSYAGKSSSSYVGGITVFFRKNDVNSSQRPYPIQCKLSDTVDEIIQKYRNKSLDNDLTKKFIFNAKALNPSLTAAEAGLTDQANVFVVTTENVRGAY